MNVPDQALDGVTVLDFTQLLQGPYATQMLGDLGADIIKIEKAGSGDLYRSMTFFNQWLPGKESPCFIPWNRNKRSLAIDLKAPEARELIFRLVEKADIVVENFRPGVMEKLGFGYGQLRERNPGVIYCSATGWGPDGPYVTRPGQDLLVQGVSGAAMASGKKSDGPVAIGTALSDQLGAMHIVYSVLAALFYRTRTGKGQKIDINLLQSVLAFEMQDFFTVQNLGRGFERPESGIAHPGNGAPFGIYETADGWISIAMNPWERIVEALGVSVMTVSYALNGVKQVSPQTREKVEEAAKRLGYVPDPLLRRLSSYRSQRARAARGTSLAWLNLHSSEKTWNFRGSHFLESYEGARKRAEELGYNLEAIHLRKLGSWKRTNGVLKSRGIEGVIIGQPPVGVDSADLEWGEFATVSVGRAIRSPEMPRVVLNHVAAIHQLLERMLRMGYRRIGLVMESGDCIKNDFRNISGYYGGCGKLGVPEQDRVPPLTPEKITAANLKKWIKKWDIEGIMIHRPDQMQKLLPEIGLKVPEDIGYAHISLHEPSSTVSGLFFAPENLGSWAVDLCHWILDRGEKGLRDPTPSLTLSTFHWNEGRTLQEKKRPDGSQVDLAD